MEGCSGPAQRRKAAELGEVSWTEGCSGPAQRRKAAVLGEASDSSSGAQCYASSLYQARVESLNLYAWGLRINTAGRCLWKEYSWKTNEFTDSQEKGGISHANSSGKAASKFALQRWEVCVTNHITYRKLSSPGVNLIFVHWRAHSWNCQRSTYIRFRRQFSY